MNAQTLTLSALHAASYKGDSKYDLHVDRPQSFAFEAKFETHDEAVAFAAQFPKSYKFNVGHCSGGTGRNGERVAPYFVVRSRAELTADGVNGGRNETAIKRYHAIVAKAEKLDVAISFEPVYAVNTYTSREQFESAL